MTRLSNTASPPQDTEIHVREAYTLPGTEQLLLHTEVREQPYRIMVAVPPQAPPPQGYPVLYVLDANALFGTLVEALRVQTFRPEKTGVYPGIVVGIGYPNERPFDESRFYDFTMETPLEVLDALPRRGKEPVRPEVGGASRFRSFIDGVLKPRIERDYPIDRSSQAIFGHSLGGLFVLQTLLTQPHTFSSYIAGSPSIHWNKPLIEEQVQQLAARLPEMAGTLKLLMTVGELENGHPSGMNANAMDIYGQLLPLRDSGLQTAFHEFEGEGHVTVLPGLASRALRFAFGGGSHDPQR